MVKDVDLTKNYYKSGEAAKIIGVDTRTVQNDCMNGLLSLYLETEEKTMSEELAEDIISIIHSFKRRNVYPCRCQRFSQYYEKIFREESSLEQPNMVGLSRGMQYAKHTGNYLCVKCIFLNFSRNTNCIL